MVSNPPLTLIFRNNSDNSGSVCVCQPALNLLQDGQASTDAVSLAWMVAACNPGGQIQFQWLPEYEFFWCQSTETPSQIEITGSQVLSAQNGNQVTLLYENGAFTFSAPVENPDVAGLAIVSDASIPPGEALAGFAMAGAGVFGVPSQPGVTVTFPLTPAPGYYVVFGQFVQGQVLGSPSTSTNSLLITFPAGVHTGVATLNADNTWTWTPVSPA